MFFPLLIINLNLNILLTDTKFNTHKIKLKLTEFKSKTIILLIYSDTCRWIFNFVSKMPKTYIWSRKFCLKNYGKKCPKLIYGKENFVSKIMVKNAQNLSMVKKILSQKLW